MADIATTIAGGMQFGNLLATYLNDQLPQEPRSEWSQIVAIYLVVSEFIQLALGWLRATLDSHIAENRSSRFFFLLDAIVNIVNVIKPVIQGVQINFASQLFSNLNADGEPVSGPTGFLFMIVLYTAIRFAKRRFADATP